MARKRRNHKLEYGRTKKANHGIKPCRGKTKLRTKARSGAKV